MNFKGKHIVLGVTGSIAAYKACGLVSHLRQMGAEIRVIMTEHATELVASRLFAELSGNPVAVNMFGKVTNFDVRHIALAAWADIFVVAPATANIIGKVASGIGDDMLSTSLISAHSPILFVPAMNTHMFDNPIVQDNMRKLHNFGYHFVDPDSGHLACNASGKGRFPEESKIFSAMDQILNGRGLLKGKKVLITAGGTREAIDPVRYIGNYSSGKMGYAIARAALREGAMVHLISANPSLPHPEGADMEYVSSAVEMKQAVDKQYDTSDVVVMAAAVADYRPAVVADQKIKKETMTSPDLKLTLNPDILLGLGERKQNQVLVGFAAETNDVIAHGREKLVRKNLDLLVANDVSSPESGFHVDENQVSLLTPDGHVSSYPRMAKEDIGTLIIEKISSIMK